MSADVVPRIKIDEGRLYRIVHSHGEQNGLVGWAVNIKTTGFGHTHFDLKVIDRRINDGSNVTIRCRDVDVEVHPMIASTAGAEKIAWNNRQITEGQSRG